VLRITHQPKETADTNGIRMWRGTREKLTSCAGTQTAQSAFVESQISVRYLATAVERGFPETAALSVKKVGK
jgi:hypothetical protein